MGLKSENNTLLAELESEAPRQGVHGILIFHARNWEKETPGDDFPVPYYWMVRFRSLENQAQSSSKFRTWDGEIEKKQVEGMALGIDVPTEYVAKFARAPSTKRF